MRSEVRAAYDMEATFNDVSLTLAPGASLPEVLARTDDLLRPGGGAAAEPAGDDAALRLGDGFRVEVRIEVERHDDVLLLPRSALFRHEGGDAVFVVGDDLHAHLRLVTLGARGPRYARVVSGLAAGERVIVHPSDSISDGRAVAPH